MGAIVAAVAASAKRRSVVGSIRGAVARPTCCHLSWGSTPEAPRSRRGRPARHHPRSLRRETPAPAAAP
eukprot:6840771-Alexandrium_andersonii.AAC.1